jgi:hypothetical protein
VEKEAVIGNKKRHTSALDQASRYQEDFLFKIDHFAGEAEIRLSWAGMYTPRSETSPAARCSPAEGQRSSRWLAAQHATL